MKLDPKNRFLHLLSVKSSKKFFANKNYFLKSGLSTAYLPKGDWFDYYRVN